MRSRVVLLRSLLVAGSVIALGLAAHARTQSLPARPGVPTAGTPAGRTSDVARAVIRGTILAGDTGAPLRSATVTLLLRDAVVRVVSTDEEGRYLFDNLDSGRYLVMARRSGYLPWAYGQRDDGLPGQVIEVNAGMRLPAIDIRLPRNSAILGRITDEFGAPVSLVRVQAWQARVVGGRRRLIAVGIPRETDDLGYYRLFGLGPGDYFLTAALKAADEDATSDVGTGSYAPTFYPGTLNSVEASEISVALGQEAVADFPLVPSAAFLVTGAAVSRSGRPAGGHVELVPRRDLVMGALMPGQFTAPLQPGGAFTIRRVPPGSYTLVVVTTGSVQADGTRLTVPESGTRLVGVDRLDVAVGEVLVTPGAVASGRITVDGVRPAVSAQGVRVTAVPVSPDEPESAIAIPPALVRSDWTFELRGLHGRRLLDVTNLPPGLSVVTIRAEGRDVGTAGIMSALAERLSVEINLTSRITEITGIAREGTRRAARDYVVVCVADDRVRQQDPLRRYQRLVRADRSGRYTVSGLPAGNYLIVAFEDVPASAIDDPPFLDRLRELAKPITLTAGASKAVDLVVQSY